MLNTIKKSMSVLLVFAVAVIPLSCKSFDPKLLEQTATFDKSVTPMRVVINTDSIKACFPGGWMDVYHKRKVLLSYYNENRQYPYERVNFFFQEQKNIINILKHNMMFDRDSRNAYLSVLVRNAEWYVNPGWMVPGSITAGILYFMGMPGASVTVTIDLEAAVMKPDGRVLKVYRTKGVDTEYFAFYWGYGDPDVFLQAHRNVLISACADIRKQIENDKENLKKITR
jgi:hypothetical protein